MGHHLRAFVPEDLPELTTALAGASAVVDLPRILAEKLEAGVHGPVQVRVASQGTGPIGIAVTSGRYLRLLAVAPAARRQGVGQALLDDAEARLRAGGHEAACAGDEPGNYVTPGIDVRDRGTRGWLEKRGYHQVRENQSLRVAIAGNPRLDPGAIVRAEADAAGYRFRRADSARDGEALAILAALPAWQLEISRALRGPSTVFVAEHAPTEELVAFAAHDGNNRGLGAFGPAATAEAHQGKGLGRVLLLACLRDLADAGAVECVISWIGPRTFYDRCVGIAGELRFAVLRKPL